MTRAELIAQIKSKTALSATAADAVITTVFDSIGGALQSGDSVTLRGFGTFKVIERSARQGRNPRTGKAITIEATRAVKFIPAPALKAGIKGE